MACTYNLSTWEAGQEDCEFKASLCCPQCDLISKKKEEKIRAKERRERRDEVGRKGWEGGTVPS